MGLTQAQQSLINKARTAGSGELGIALDDGICSFLLGCIITDLNLLGQFPQFTSTIPQFFSNESLQNLRLDNISFLDTFEKLLNLIPDADTYFYCLAVLHKARLKYERILQTQAFPTIDQVGPRGLLQYGSLSSRALVGLLSWRKWMFDVDNRAGQETGYVFEPIIAYAIGGVPYSASKSPIKRDGIGQAGRQVDCIRDNKAYEIKLRVTIAASGQGRWREELAFPNDCMASNFVPVLIVLDPTPNPKLAELHQAFLKAGGEAFIGQAAWDHLSGLAGSTMANFLQRYVHQPIQTLLTEESPDLPPLSLAIHEDILKITIGDEQLSIKRNKINLIPSENDIMPDDVNES